MLVIGASLLITMDIVLRQREIVREQSVSQPVGAIAALLEIVKEARDTATMSELVQELRGSIDELQQRVPSIAIRAGCDLFMRLVSLYDSDRGQSSKHYLLTQGQRLIERAATQKMRIIDHCAEFVRDGSTILVHGFSRVVLAILLHAFHANKRFFVYCTESRPSDGGFRAFSLLRERGVPCHLLMDSAVGFVMDSIDFVLVGAEAVVENGGLVNCVGTYQMAVMAKHMRKPFYAACESVKFVREFPLNQHDLPHAPQLHSLRDDRDPDEPISSISGAADAGAPGADPSNMSSLDSNAQLKQHLLKHHPLVDYTPPQFITLLFTDLGVITPSGVSDELIKLY